MRKSIFKKDEEGKFIIDFANVDFDYYKAVANTDMSPFDRGAFIVLSFYEDDEGLYRELKEKRLIESKSLVYRGKELKSRYIRFAKKNLIRYNPKLTEESTKDNILAILDEYENNEYDHLKEHLEDDFKDGIDHLLYYLNITNPFCYNIL